jgi:predicted RNase H-like HicB family nuclease
MCDNLSGVIDGRFRHGIQCACVIDENEDNTGMKSYTAVGERDQDTGLLVGYVPGFPGAHSQAESLDELQANLHEVIAMLLEDGEPRLEAEFVGTQSIAMG